MVSTVRHTKNVAHGGMWRNSNSFSPDFVLTLLTDPATAFPRPCRRSELNSGSAQCSFQGNYHFLLLANVCTFNSRFFPSLSKEHFILNFRSGELCTCVSEELPVCTQSVTVSVECVTKAQMGMGSVCVSRRTLGSAVTKVRQKERNKKL